MALAPGLALALALAPVSGCLSGGPPPTGLTLTRGRDVAEVAFLPSPTAPRLFAWRTRPGPVRPYFPPETDLHWLIPDAGGDSVEDRLLVERSSGFQFGRDQVDALGRLLVVVSSGPVEVDPSIPPRPGHVVLADPETGQTVDLGPVTGYSLSPSGRRLAYATGDYETSTAHLRELDGRDVILGSGQEFLFESFVGEDLYYLSPSKKTLDRIPPDGTPEHIADDVLSFGRNGTLLFLQRDDGTPYGRSSIFDPITLEQTALPMAVQSVSPDGRWIFGYVPPVNQLDPPSYRFLLFDRDTGTAQTLDLGDTVVNGDPSWRPGHDELWLAVYSAAPEALSLVIRPGAPPLMIPRLLFRVPRNEFDTSSPFTGDGAHFFAWTPGTDPGASNDKFGISLVPVDDPAGAGIRVNPEGSGVTKVWELSRGRLLVEAWYAQRERSDLILIDIATGTSRLLGEAGSVVNVGDTRVLARLRIVAGAGDLVLIDFDTGATTRLAESVIHVAVEPRAGADPLAAGTRVAYVLRNPIASAYDGAWLVTLP